MPERPILGYVVPHTLAFVREQMLTAASFFSYLPVVVARPRPALLERSWTGRSEPDLESTRFHVQRLLTPLSTSYGPYPLASIGLARIRVPTVLKDASVLHAHFLYPQGLLAKEWARQLGIPYVLTGHGYDVYGLTTRNRAWSKCLHDVLSHASAITTVSESNRGFLENAGVDRTRIQVIPNGFDPTLFHPVDRDSARNRLGVAAEAEVVLYVGNLIASKQVELLIRTIAQARRTRSSLQLVVLGGGPEANRLRKETRRLGLETLVRFLGETSHLEVARWMQASNVLCLPSRAEGLPAVVIEALASGCPVVAARVGGLPSLLSDESGVLVPPGDVEQLTIAIQSALERPWNRGAIAASARRFARSALVPVWQRVYTASLG